MGTSHHSTNYPRPTNCSTRATPTHQIHCSLVKMQLFWLIVCVLLAAAPVLAQDDDIQETNINSIEETPEAIEEITGAIEEDDEEATEAAQEEITEVASQETTTDTVNEEATVAPVEDETGEDEETITEDEDTSFTGLLEAIMNVKDKLVAELPENLADQVGDVLNNVVNAFSDEEAPPEVTTELVEGATDIDEPEATLDDAADRVDESISIFDLPSKIYEALKNIASNKDAVEDFETKVGAVVNLLPSSVQKPLKNLVDAVEDPLKTGLIEPVENAISRVDLINSSIAATQNALWWFNRAALAGVFAYILLFVFNVNIGYNLLGWVFGWKYRAITAIFDRFSGRSYDSVGWLLGEPDTVKRRRHQIQNHFYHPEQIQRRYSARTAAPILNSISQSYQKYQE